jgi:hypothetical protein
VFLVYVIHIHREFERIVRHPGDIEERIRQADDRVISQWLRPVVQHRELRPRELDEFIRVFDIRIDQLLIPLSRRSRQRNDGTKALSAYPAG